MKLIAGLGNPENKYVGTRHNVGFDVIDRLAAKYGIDVSSKKHKALTGTGIIEGQKVLLIKPLTYMNLSGESIADAVGFYKCDPATDLIVIHDDVSLALGQLRVRGKGSAGGHNGIKSIISHVGDEFVRIKFGVGEKPEDWDLADYVLGHFPQDEWEAVRGGVLDACGAVEILLTKGVSAAQNIYNQRKS